MINKDFFQALDQLEREKKISKDLFIESLAAGIASAYKKETGLNRGIDIQLNPVKCTIRVFAYRIVVNTVEDEEKEISLEDARKVKSVYNLGDHFIDDEISTKLFTRIAAQTAKQVIMQRINDARKSLVLSEMNEKEGEIVTAIIRRVENNNVYVEISGSQMEGIMMPSVPIRFAARDTTSTTSSRSMSKTCAPRREEIPRSWSPAPASDSSSVSLKWKCPRSGRGLS